MTSYRYPKEQTNLKSRGLTESWLLSITQYVPQDRGLAHDNSYASNKQDHWPSTAKRRVEVMQPFLVPVLQMQKQLRITCAGQGQR